MIMGEICTRRCPFCDVGHGKPNPLDEDEPLNLAKAIKEMSLGYVVITSVDRMICAMAVHSILQQEAKTLSPDLKVEVLVPDFRARMQPALDILSSTPPDVLITIWVPRSLIAKRDQAPTINGRKLLKEYKALNPQVY